MISRHPLFVEHRIIATLAELAAIAAAGVSIGGTVASATQSAPRGPNAASASRRVAYALANALPIQRGISAAEQQGGQYSAWVPGHNEPTQFVRVPIDDNMGSSAGDFGSRQEQATHSAGPFAFTPGAELFGIGSSGPQYKYIPYHAEDWQEGGKYAGTAFTKGPNAPGSDAWMRAHVVTRGQHVAGHTQNYDFSGYGTADIEGELARQYAHLQEQLGAKYGTQFAEEARHEAELADPQSFAARAKELELIQQGIDNPAPINPMATTLDQRMTERLKAGSGLDSMSQEALDKAIQGANASRGGSLGAGDVAESLSTGVEGAARRQAAIQDALRYVGSGVSPGDVQYRREQQNLQNLGSFVAGRTPESEFQNLSGAGAAGAAPFYGGQPLPQQPSNAGAGGPQYALANWQAGLRQQQSQVGGWTTGLSALLGSIGALGRAGVGSGG
jgi:hypothetical protein